MQKTIKINPELFSLKKDKQDNRSLKREQKKSIDRDKTSSILSSTNIAKKKLLERVKEMQKQQSQHSQNTNRDTNSKNNIGASSGFDESMGFLDSLSKKHAAKDKQGLNNKSMKVRKSTYETIDMKLPEELSRLEHNIGETTTYGCLKNGTLPTYRDWKRMTQKKPIFGQPTRIKINTDLNTSDDNGPVAPLTSAREQKLHEIREQFRATNYVPASAPATATATATADKLETKELDEPLELLKPCIKKPESVSKAGPVAVAEPVSKAESEPIIEIIPEKEGEKEKNIDMIQQIPISLNDPIREMAEMEKLHVKNLPKIHRHTKTYKYRLGKSKRDNKIGVFIKNRTTLKNIKRDFKQLQNVDISEIKKYLRLHNLIKVGTSAPNDVLRELYEKAVLSGNINNNNSETLLYNFREEDDDV